MFHNFNIRGPIAWVAIAVLLSWSPAAPAEELAPLLKSIAEAGLDGEATEQVSAAWNRLSRFDADRLPEVLSGLDTAEPLAANWISAAVDAIAERAIQRRRPLPADELERFVLDTTHSARARRLAFDWLARIDASAPDRLIPGMLHDPGVEFRRDAVARLLDEAERLFADDQTADAEEVYRQAFSGARDLDQVQQIAGELKKLGHDVDLRRHFGFLVDWKLIGPFDNTDEQGFDVVYPPEVEIEFDGVYEGKETTVRWINHTTDDELGMVDLNAALGKANGVTGYAMAEFYSPGEINLELRLGCICAAKLWLNGQLLAAHEVYHSGTQIDQYISPATIRPGRNVILLKVCQNAETEPWAQDWEFQLRVCDASGTAVLSTPPNDDGR